MSGYALRFPRIVRIRDDKPVEESDTLEAVQRLAGVGKVVCSSFVVRLGRDTPGFELNC